MIMKTSAFYPQRLIWGDEILAAVLAARWLGLAATPTFVSMALVTKIHANSMPDMLCPAAGNPWPLSGMCLMYLLMGLFHLGPWLKMIGRR